MGLFDFVSNVGKKLGIGYFEKQEELKKEADESARVDRELELRKQLGIQITQALVSKGYELESPSVMVGNGGKAYLTGTAKNQAAKEKAILFIGNHEGITQVDDEKLTVLVTEPPALFHTVQKGESLSLISKRYYGIIMAFPVIAEANQNLVTDVNDIDVGWIIRIPPIASFAYTAKAGDTLGTIAKTMYGDAKLYTKIFEASKNVMANPDVVKPGMALTIPILHPLPAPTPAGAPAAIS